MHPTAPLAIALCADDAFAMPLAVAVRSVLATTACDDLRLFVVDCGLRAASRERLRASWPGVEVAWVEAPAGVLDDVPLSGHASRANYARMLLPDLLPPDVERVLYLDCDLVADADLRGLWDLPLEGAACLAAQDVGVPYVDGETAPNLDVAREHIAVLHPIRNYRELGLDGRAKYFNSGVLLMDLAAWRAEEISRRLLDCLRAHHEHVRLWDQYLLNVVLATRWRELPARWNAQSRVHRYPSWRESPYDEATWHEVVHEPAIVHFADTVKPWHHAWPYPGSELFFRHLDATAWAGWRPRRPFLGLDLWRRHRWLRSFRRRWLGQNPARPPV